MKEMLAKTNVKAIDIRLDKCFLKFEKKSEAEFCAKII
jgi:hypothetical protein